MNRLALSALIFLLSASASFGALEEGSYGTERGRKTLVYEDTSAANAQVVILTTVKTYSRVFRAISIECSGSATTTATSVIRRANVGVGTLDIGLADIVISAALFGVQYVDIPMAPDDVVEVTIPAAGVGVTCTGQVLELTEDAPW